MIALEQARQYMESLGLTEAVEVLDSRLDAAARKQMPYPDMLADLLGIEVAARRERYLTTRTRMAHLPFRRTLEQFEAVPDRCQSGTCLRSNDDPVDAGLSPI